MSETALEQQLRGLEQRLDELSVLCLRLQAENSSLKAQQIDLVEERARLVEKNEMARSKVEQMITQLKSLEASP